MRVRLPAAEREQRGDTSRWPAVTTTMVRRSRKRSSNTTNNWKPHRGKAVAGGSRCRHRRFEQCGAAPIAGCRSEIAPARLQSRNPAVRTHRKNLTASIAFRITDQKDQQDQPGYGKGHQSRAYLIVPRGGVVTVTCGDGFDVTGQPKQPKNVSEEIGIQRREDGTVENVKKLIMRCPGARITTIT
jgi:hypothetical protein